MNVRMTLAAALVAFASACAQSAPESNAPGPVLQTEQTEQTETNLPDDGPPVGADGLYNNMDACPGEFCSVSPWQRITAQTPLLEQPTPAASVVAMLPEGEWVRALGSMNRWRPARGVVVDEEQAQFNLNGPGPLQQGDVVYTIGYEGEGFITLWRRGAEISWYPPGGDDQIGAGSVVGGIRWDSTDRSQRNADTANGSGFWIQAQRENGQSGWVRAETVECLSGMDPTDACRTRNSP